MENAVDALKMAFAVLIFLMALTVAITMFSQLNSVSRVVLASSDQTLYYEYEKSNSPTRVVGLETIIPTLYKYYKENYTVVFLNEKGKPLPLYMSQTDIKLWGTGEKDPITNKYAGIIGKYYNKNKPGSYDKDNAVCTFDVDEETLRHEPWTGKPEDFKLNLDKFLQGGFFPYPSGEEDEKGNKIGYNYGKDDDKYGNSVTNNNGGFIERYNDRQFTEYLGEYEYDISSEEDDDDLHDVQDYNSGLQKNRKKRVIIYQLLPEEE